MSGLHTEEQTYGTEGLCVCVHACMHACVFIRGKDTLEFRENAEAT